MQFAIVIVQGPILNWVDFSTYLRLATDLEIGGLSAAEFFFDSEEILLVIPSGHKHYSAAD